MFGISCFPAKVGNFVFNANQKQSFEVALQHDLASITVEF